MLYTVIYVSILSRPFLLPVYVSLLSFHHIFVSCFLFILGSPSLCRAGAGAWGQSQRGQGCWREAGWDAYSHSAVSPSKHTLTPHKQGDIQELWIPAIWSLDLNQQLLEASVCLSYPLSVCSLVWQQDHTQKHMQTHQLCPPLSFLLLH